MDETNALSSARRHLLSAGAELADTSVSAAEDVVLAMTSTTVRLRDGKRY
jgi:hypothetical protein